MPKGIYARTEEQNRKMSIACKGKNKGRKLSKEHKRKISIYQKSRSRGTSWNKGKTGVYSEATKEQIRKSVTKVVKRGEQCHFWRGGTWHNPYSTDWTRTLRRSIRERDHYTCQLCGELQGDYAFDVHHVDYNKLNCNPENLITLCRTCHSKTNMKRGDWKKRWKSSSQ